MNMQRNEGPYGMPVPGRPFKETHTQMIPTGDKLINAARSALWDAWQIGLQKGGNTVYPRLPLLDREPIEPEI